MVTDAYLNVYHHPSVEDFYRHVNGRPIIAIDNIEGAKSVIDYKFPASPVLVFGGEGPGLSLQMIEAAQDIVMIPQRGSTRSVNVGVASGIILYAWSVQNGLFA